MNGSFYTSGEAIKLEQNKRSVRWHDEVIHAREAHGMSKWHACHVVKQPEHIHSGDGPEFAAKDLRKWLADTGEKTLYIEPGSPWENGYGEVESKLSTLPTSPHPRRRRDIDKARPLVSPAMCRWLCGLNIGYVNHVASCVERSGNRHLFVLVLLRIVLIIEEVSGYFALRRLACDQGILSVLELHNLACECLLLVLLRLPLLGVAATLGLGRQARGESAEGRRQNQCEPLFTMIAPLHYLHLPPVFFVCLQP
jgi:hypothetical protein